MLNTVKLAGILVVIGCSFGAGPVWAQCVEGTTDGLGRTPVTCDTANDTDGYAAAVDAVDVVVAAGFDVAHGAATEAILLREDSTVVNDGTITATADDTQGVEAGNNATVTNQGGGRIQGGGGIDGAAILFSGDDATANNIVNNSGTGEITTSGTGTVAIQGSVGNETITLSDTSTLTGDIILGGGDDIVTIQDDATATGNVNLGDGTDSFTLDAATYAGALTGGAGTNTISIQNQATFSGAYTGGVDADIFVISSDSASSGLLNLGDGENRVTVAGGNATTL
nr:hypothetical protein [Pseudomonadota bacterium]